MKIPGPVVDALVGTEKALDRLKLAYKARFDRFAPAMIVPYRGYGRPDRLVLRGRVLEANETGFEPEPGLLDNLRNTLRRMETDEIRGARIMARYRGLEVEVTADDEAFFELDLSPDTPAEPGWQEIRLEIMESMAEETAGPTTGEVLVPSPGADFLVVSDLDDTVIRTGASSRFSMFRTVLLNDARTRLPFQGVVPFYRALAAGPSGGGANPFFYLSRSPWNLYEMLAGFLDHHDLPKGPILLKDYGLRGILSGDQQEYKKEILDHLFDFYPGQPFVLIGDSGQHDPEVYREVARERPDRVRAIIIRDVTPDRRDREIRGIVGELEELGIPMILAGDSREAAREAADLGLMAGDRVEDMNVGRASEADAPTFLQRLLDGALTRDGSG